MLYISFVYIAISIWCLPIAILMWAAIFSLPTQWGMANILYSGIKVVLTIILTVILVMIYTEGTLSGEAERMKTFEMSDLWNDPAGTVSRFAMGTNTTIFSIASFFAGTSPDLLIASMLIFTAPAQAAGIIKGVNGIAESAKNSMMSGGAASGINQVFGYQQGGANVMGGGSSLGGGAVNLSSFQKNMGPVP